MEHSPKKQHSHDKGSSKKLPIFVQGELDDYGLDPFAFRLFGRIARRAGRDGGSYESVAHMAAGCQMSEGTVKRKLKYLISIGAITKSSRPGRTTVYRPHPLELWQPRSDATQVLADPAIDLTDPGTDLSDLDVDQCDLPPRSDLTDEVTPLSSSPPSSFTKGSPNNNCSGGFLSVKEISAKVVTLPNADQIEPTSRDGVIDSDENLSSALPQDWEERAQHLGVKVHDRELREAFRKFPDCTEDAIAAMKETAANGTQIRNPTRWLTAAIRDGYKPEKLLRTQSSVSPVPLDESQVPPAGTPEYRDWLEDRTRNAPWRLNRSA